MNEYNDARKLAKALSAINPTVFQMKAAAMLLKVNGLQSALEFVAEMDKLNKMRDSGELDRIANGEDGA